VLAGFQAVTMDKKNALAFEEITVNVMLTLFALWSSVMFFNICGDYFQLYQAA